MTASEPQPAAPYPKLRWYQWRLRSLFLLTLLVAVGMSWFAVRMQRAREQQAAARELNKFEDAFVWYDCQVNNQCGLGPEANNTPRGPGWLRGLLGDDLFNDVTRVNLSGMETDDDLIHLRAFPRLRHLLLDGTQVTDDGLKHLESLTCLEFLSLGRLKITDAGLMHLYGLNRLQRLTLDGTRVTDKGVAKLQQALPKCEIER